MKNCEESYLGSGHLQVLIQSAQCSFPTDVLVAILQKFYTLMHSNFNQGEFETKLVLFANSQFFLLHQVLRGPCSFQSAVHF